MNYHIALYFTKKISGYNIEGVATQA